jgi:immune inhibitor A
VLKANANINQAALKTEVRKLLGVEGRVPGLNDGIVFPKTNLQSGTPIRAAAASAANRAPLTGAIKYAVIFEN